MNEINIAGYLNGYNDNDGTRIFKLNYTNWVLVSSAMLNESQAIELHRMATTMVNEEKCI